MSQFTTTEKCDQNMAPKCSFVQPKQYQNLMVVMIIGWWIMYCVILNQVPSWILNSKSISSFIALLYCFSLLLVIYTFYQFTVLHIIQQTHFQIMN